MVPEVTQAADDKQQVEPMLKKLAVLPAGQNTPATLLADTGDCREANLVAGRQARITPLIAVKREGHHTPWQERFTEPEPLAEGADPVVRMKHALTTQAGKQAHALRKPSVEAVFGSIKSVMKSRQFMRRGLANVRNHWTPACLVWNLKRRAALRPKTALSSWKRPRKARVALQY